MIFLPCRRREIPRGRAGDHASPAFWGAGSEHGRAPFTRSGVLMNATPIQSTEEAVMPGSFDRIGSATRIQMCAPIAPRHAALAAVVEGTHPVIRRGTGGSPGSHSSSHASGGLSGTHMPGPSVMCYTGHSGIGDVKPRSAEDSLLSPPSCGLSHRTPLATSGGHLLRTFILLRAFPHEVAEGPAGAGVRVARGTMRLVPAGRRPDLRRAGVRPGSEHASRELRMLNDVGSSRHGLVSMRSDAFNGRVVRPVRGLPWNSDVCICCAGAPSPGHRDVSAKS